MIYMERWKVILIIAICALGILYALPNVLGRGTVVWLEANAPSFLPTKTVNLGLDLRGGSQLLLEVDTGAVIAERMQSLVDQARTELRARKIGYTDLGSDGKGLHFRLIADSMDKVDAAREILREIERGLDVTVDGDKITAVLEPAKIHESTSAALERSIEIVRRRIDETGTREPTIQMQGENRILVQLPGVDNPEQIKRLLGQTARLSFRLVTDISGGSTASVPVGTERLPLVEAERGPGGPTHMIVQKRVMVSGDMLVDSQPSFQEGQPVVSFRFDSVGAKRFAETTRNNIGRPFAIVMDDKIISSPVIREAITGGSGIISGSFTTESANELALLLRAGALPAPIHVLEERTIGPGLGADSIKAGAIAAVVGAVLVMVFMVVVYGLFGVFAVVALILNIAMLFAMLSVLQATLTLPGIAGIVLTIGTAVDANVLIFERIREEIRAGRSPIPAIDTGYNRAMSSILDANLTTLIASTLLYIFGSGSIKGFAVTLTLGIITSIFSALMVTRLLVIIWVRRTRPKVIPI